MPVCSGDIKNFADSLCTTDEVTARAAVGRYYYAAYHAIMELFPVIPNYSNMGSHESIIHYLAEDAHRLEKLPKRTMLRLSLKLNAMKARRVAADYKIGDEFQPSMAAIMKNEVESFFSIYSEISTDIANRKTSSIKVTP